MRKVVLNFGRLVPSLNHDEMQFIQNAFDSVEDAAKIREIIESTQERERICPHCKSRHIYRHGQSNGLQRYRCQSCKKTYNALTETPLARLRKKEKWMQYLTLMLNSTVLRDAATALDISLPTAFKWRHRFSEWLQYSETNHLEGIVEVDETYFKKSKKGCKKLNRPAHKRGEKAKQRGLSKEQVCVFTAQDRSSHSYGSVAGVGPVSSFWLNKRVFPLIAHDSIIVADGLASYQSMAKKGKLSLVVVHNKPGKRVQGAYHIQHINALHSRLKGWINGRFRGVSTKYLNHYLWWRHEIESKHIETATDLFMAALHQTPQVT
jgi:transposase-like protein